MNGSGLGMGTTKGNDRSWNVMAWLARPRSGS